MPHISYSELKQWAECTWIHKLLYVDKVETFQGNEHTSFGTAVHETVEKMLTENISDPYEYFDKKFNEILEELGLLDSDLANTMRQEINGIFEAVRPAIDSYFEDKGGWSIVAAEESLKEPITESRVEGYDFKGFIDLVIKDGHGHYHVIDWKTCSWGWDSKKRSDKMIAYQLVLYKHYFCKKHNIDPKNVETHFALLKRTAKKDIVEVFSVTSGTKRTENALELLQRAIETIKSGVHIKNKLSCTSGYGCEFYKTQYCK